MLSLPRRRCGGGATASSSARRPPGPGSSSSGSRHQRCATEPATASTTEASAVIPRRGDARGAAPRRWSSSDQRLRHVPAGRAGHRRRSRPWRGRRPERRTAGRGGPCAGRGRTGGPPTRARHGAGDDDDRDAANQGRGSSPTALPGPQVEPEPGHRGGDQRGRARPTKSGRASRGHLQVHVGPGLARGEDRAGPRARPRPRLPASRQVREQVEHGDGAAGKASRACGSRAAHGASTKARVAARGCGSTRSGVRSARPP